MSPEYRIYNLTLIKLEIFNNGNFMTIYEKLENSVFYAVSFLTTTGFSTINYIDWGNASLIIIFILLFIGGCAGSTTGGIKLIRTLLILKFSK